MLTERLFLYDAMHDVYFWSAQSPTVDTNSYATDADLLTALKVSADKWSYTITQQAYNDYYAGANIGLGTKLSYSSVTNQIFITLVYPDSPADDAGMKRGYELLSINGYSARDIIQNDLWDEAFGPAEDGYVTDISYLDTNGVSGTSSIVKTIYYAHSAPVHNIFTNGTNGNKIGYLHYVAFSSNYATDLSDAWDTFEANDIKELIIDLRYNGGGQISAARAIGSTVLVTHCFTISCMPIFITPDIRLGTGLSLLHIRGGH